jgi:hypothetical protein
MAWRTPSFSILMERPGQRKFGRTTPASLKTVFLFVYPGSLDNAPSWPLHLTYGTDADA